MMGKGKYSRKGMLSSCAVALNWRPLVISVWTCLLLLCAQQQIVHAEAVFLPTGNMTTARVNHTATTLADGRVLITGGTTGGANPTYLDTAEIYDPAADNGTGAFTATGKMYGMRAFHTATLLLPPDSDGYCKVLITGGKSGLTTYLNTAEIYDPNPKVNKFISIGSMTTARYLHTATLFKDKNNSYFVLVAGGKSSSSSSSRLPTVQIYNTTTGLFSAEITVFPVIPVNAGRYSHTATLLNDGRILFAGGGYSNPGTKNSADIYTPSTGTLTTINVPMSVARYNHTAVLLNDGKVLIAGGDQTTLSTNATAEIFNPIGVTGGTDSFIPPTPTTTMTSARTNHTATLLPNGQVLIAGGNSIYGDTNLYPEEADLFEPSAGAGFITPVTMTTGRAFHSAALTYRRSAPIINDKVLIAGGDEVFNGLPSVGGLPSNSAALYDDDGVVIPPTKVGFSITFDGWPGGGSTSSKQSELNCLSSAASCEAMVALGTPISVTAIADGNSVFNRWSGGCIGINPCSLTVDVESSAVATFDYVEPALIVNTSSVPKAQSSLQNAYDVVSNNFVDPTVIKARYFTFTESLLFDKNISITLIGGFDPTFASYTNNSEVDGGLTVSNGSLTIDKFTVKGVMLIKNSKVTAQQLIVRP
jgi:hypothetical protein